MPKKKITVVNIDDNETKNDEVIDVNEPVEEPVEVPQEPIEIQQDPIEKLETIEESPKELETPPVENTPIKQPETNTKTRLQELIQCPKCNKMIKAKTLKYSHKNTCSGEEKNKLKKEKPLPKPEPVHDIEEVPQPKLVKSMPIIPEREPTAAEIMREYRQKMMKERLQLRQDKMENLFANSIK